MPCLSTGTVAVGLGSCRTSGDPQGGQTPRAPALGTALGCGPIRGHPSHRPLQGCSTNLLFLASTGGLCVVCAQAAGKVSVVNTSRHKNSLSSKTGQVLFSNGEQKTFGWGIGRTERDYVRLWSLTQTRLLYEFWGFF